MGLVTSESWHVNEHPKKVFNPTNAYTFGQLLAEGYRHQQRFGLWAGIASGRRRSWILIRSSPVTISGRTVLHLSARITRSSRYQWKARGTWSGAGMTTLRLSVESFDAAVVIGGDGKADHALQP